MKTINVAAEIKRLAAAETQFRVMRKTLSVPGRYGSIDKTKDVVVDAHNFCDVWFEAKFLLRFLGVLKSTKVKEISVTTQDNAVRVTFGRAHYYLKGIPS